MVVKTITVVDAERAAMWLQTLLAVDKGVPSTLKATNRGWLLTTDEGKEVVFVEGRV